ncbi:putative WRKY transcription factor 41 [Carex rostrata]
MENGTMNDNKSMNKSCLLHILSEGEEEMRRLSLNLNEPQKAAAMQVQKKFSRAIDIVNSMEVTGMQQMPVSGSPGQSGSGSPRSEGSERSLKKRKGTVKRTIKVQCTVPNSGPLDAASAPDDGYSWRKYGQKKILNATHPRSYYRCTFQKTQNCQALKQVQRSDEDPTIFDVTYQGEHVCAQHAAQTSLTQSLGHQHIIPTQNESDKQFMLDFTNPNPSFLIETHESGHDEQGTIISPSFSISSNPNVFSPSSTSFGGAFSSGFGSSGASDSNYFSAFPNEFGGDFAGVSNFHGSDFELNDVMPCSGTNDFSIEQPTYPFNSPHAFK